MSLSQKISRGLLVLVQVFIIGLLFQFFLHTLVSFQLGWTGTFWDFFWLWKEFVILLLLLGTGYFLYLQSKKKGISKLWQDFLAHPFSKFVLIFFIFLILSLLFAVVFQKVGIGTWILSLKYDAIGFFLVILGVGLAWRVPSLQSKKLTRRYQKIFPSIILAALAWWGVLLLIPGFFKLFGYSTERFEGTVGVAPPAAYYTDINKGIARNQFLFERPISLGFFLVAFWPLFALSFLRKQSRRKQIIRTFLFAITIFSTFSRAAIGVWILETALIFLIFYHKNIKKLLVVGGIPALIVILGAAWYFRDAFTREHSNTGHTVLLQEGWKLAMQQPLIGRGASYAGPASHQICAQSPADMRCQIIEQINTRYQITTYGYNPENQYVQILMEYGFLGLLPWLAMLVWMLYYTFRSLLRSWRELQKGKKADKKLLSQYLVFGALGIGLFALLLEGLLLHSLVDRMIIYPFMLLFGQTYGRQYPLKAKGKFVLEAQKA